MAAIVRCVSRGGAWFVGALAFAFAGGCSSEPGAAGSGDEGWLKELQGERARNQAELRDSPVSPLTAVERRTLRGSGPAYVQADAEAVRISDEASQGATLAFRAEAPGRWKWERLGGGVTVRPNHGDRELAPGLIEQPSVFRLGRFSLLAQTAADSLVVMIHDSKREELGHYRGLDYFAPDRRFAVPAEVERWAESQEIVIPTTLNLTKSYHRYARLRFAVGGQSCELTAYKPVGGSGKSLFIPFRDATSGRSSYGGGRYLDVDVPAGGTLELDFNRAYNPMCSYSPAYNCPIPPAENRLRVAIEAGEKTYAH